MTRKSCTQGLNLSVNMSERCDIICSECLVVCLPRCLCVRARVCSACVYAVCVCVRVCVCARVRAGVTDYIFKNTFLTH